MPVRNPIIENQPAPHRPACSGDSPVIRWVLVAVALAFLGLFLVLPLIGVFAKAFEKGISQYWAAMTETDARSAIRLTLLTAAIAVPLNVLFGLAASWAIAKFDFVGKKLLISLIDIPFSVSPVISGMIFVLLFGARGVFRPVAGSARHSNHL